MEGESLQILTPQISLLHSTSCNSAISPLVQKTNKYGGKRFPWHKPLDGGMSPYASPVISIESVTDLTQFKIIFSKFLSMPMVSMITSKN